MAKLRARSRYEKMQADAQRRRQGASEAQEATKSPTLEHRKKKPDPNTFQSDHPTLTYLGQYLSFTNIPPPPPPGPIMTAALNLPPDIRFLHYEHATDALDKLEAHQEELEEEEDRIAEQKAEEAELEEEEAEEREERREEGEMKRERRLLKKRRERAGTYRPFKNMSVEDAVDQCWEFVDEVMAKHGKDYFMQFPFESRSDYVERMKTAQSAIEKPLKQYREEMEDKIEEWEEDSDEYGEEEEREVAEGGRPRLMEKARQWNEERMVYHWSGMPIWKNEARPPRVLARKGVDRGAGKCHQCAAAEDDVICTRREGLKDVCGRCLRLGLDCLVPSTQYTYSHHRWHYGTFGEGNTDPLPRYAMIRKNEVYNRLPPKEDIEAWDRLREFLDRVKKEDRRLKREKREKGRSVEWVGGERGFVVRDKGRHDWALPRAEFENGRFVGFDRKKMVVSMGKKKVRQGGGKKGVLGGGRDYQKRGVRGQGDGEGLQSKRKSKDESAEKVTVNENREVELVAVVEEPDKIEDDHGNSDGLDDGHNEGNRSLKDELKRADQK